MWQRITFKVAGKSLNGKVIQKQKPKSSYKNIVGIRMEDNSEQDFDFSKDVEDWF